MNFLRHESPRRPGQGAVRRRLTIISIVAAAFAVFAGNALADAPDVKIGPTQSPVVTAKAVVNADGTVTVTVTGGWNWPTHGKDCNADRAGAGVAIDWFDPKQPGNPIGSSVMINGVSTPIDVGSAAGNSRNPADNVVHPTENDTGSGAVQDISDPSQYGNWRGSCGVYSSTTNLSGAAETMSHGNIGRVAPGDVDGNGNPFGDPTPPAGAAQQGALLQHTYASAADVTRVCAVMYDVHGGKKPADSGQNGVGIPGGAKDVTAGGANNNDDNGVHANGGTPLGNACPSVNIVVPAPAISIVKSPKAQTIANGGTATFTIAVTNTGNVALSNVTVSDPASPDCNRALGTLAAGASAPSYTCTKTGVTASFTNTATATGTTPSGSNVTASDTADVTVLAAPAPAISIVKSPKAQTIANGGTATFTIAVTNTGNVALSNVTVNDPASPDCNRALGTLAAGASAPSYTCTKTGVTASFTNTATATGTTPSGSNVTASDTADVTVLGAPAPAISIVKSPKSQTVTSGGTATFTIMVTNSGNVQLTNVTVADASSPDCNRSLGTMASGAQLTYNCSRGGVTASFTNVAVATGTPPSGPNVTASDTADVTVITPGVPGISIVKNPKAQTVTSGGTATFVITVTNSGGVQLTNVTVTDNLSPDCNRSLGTMASGAQVTYTCTRTGVTGSFTNVAVATGTPPSGSNVTATDTADVTVVAPGGPAISIVKGPKTQTVTSGGTATFTITVTNTGGVELKNVTVTDALAPDCNRSLGTMAVGAIVNYTCTLANVTASFTNVAIVTATPPAGPNVTSTDTAPITVPTPPGNPIHPSIKVVKGPKSQTVPVGGTAKFTITVTNTGDVALTDVKVTDAITPSCSRKLGTLQPGATVSYSCTQPNVKANFDNVAVVTGTPPTGPVVTATDTAPVRSAPLKPAPPVKKKTVKKPAKKHPKVISHRKPKTTG